MRSHLQQIAEDTGLECIAYSGRGMGGRRCLGIIARWQEIVGAVFCSGLSAEDADDLAGVFARAQEDSLGLGVVVYFPGVAYDGADAEPDL